MNTFQNENSIKGWRFQLFFLGCLLLSACNPSTPYFHVQFIDQATGKGIPIVKIAPLSRADYYSDSEGNIAFYEAGLMDKEVYFTVQSEGYRIPNDAHGARAVVLFTASGTRKVIQMERIQPAERLYRITGSGIYRDTELLGLPSPLPNPTWNGGEVLGQDSNLGIIHKGKTFFVWGDTFLPPRYKGNFSVAAATSQLPKNGGMDPSLGMELNYFTDDQGRSKSMIQLDGPGYVWFDWLMHVQNPAGEEVLAAKYARVNAFFGNYERGVAVFNEEKEIFEKSTEVPGWLFTQSHTCQHPFLAEVDTDEKYYLSAEFAFSRVSATLKAVSDPEQYEYFTFLKEGSGWSSTEPERMEGELVYGWKSGTGPISEKQQKQFIDAEAISPDERWFQFVDAQTGKEIERVGRGSIYWNAYKGKWIFIGGHTHTWYSEADSPLGPWHYATKVAEHNNFFYNPKQHDFLDQENGRVVFFEGTYTKFMGPEPTVPRYDYNQIMYRLQLDDPRLQMPEPVYSVSGALKLGGDMTEEDWSKTTEIAFFAMPNNFQRSELVNVFQDSEGLITTNETNRLAFAGVKNELAPERAYIGDWDITVGFESFDNFFQASITYSDGIDVSSSYPDFEVSEPDFFDDSVRFTLVHEGGTYHLAGKNIAGTIKGKWTKEGSGLSAGWSAEIQPTDQFWPIYNGRLVDLYRVKNRFSEEIRYLPENKITEEWMKQQSPLCQVWINPFRYLVVDPSIRPKIN